MNIKISKTNSKLGIIPSISLPPITTCRPNCPCAKDCYARKGRFNFAKVKSNLGSNYKLYTENPKNYFDEIKKTINNGIISYSYFRWHTAGDFVDMNYFSNVIKTAKDLPCTEFLAFTKKFEIVNEYIRNGGTIPKNLHIIFSAWGDDFKIENPYNFPIAYVRFEDKENKSIPNDAIECSGDCTNCLKCWNINKGQNVVFNKH